MRVKKEFFKEDLNSLYQSSYPARLVLDLVLADVQSNVHSFAAKDDTTGSANEPKIISAISSHADYFMENYLLVKVG